MLPLPDRAASIKKEGWLALQESEMTKLLLGQVYKTHNFICLFYVYFNFEISLGENDTEIFQEDRNHLTSVHISSRHLYHQHL